jgi:uncharacterized protein (TIGR02996 family)
MPRLSLVDDVWEVAQDGVRLVIVAAGKQTVRRFISPDHAKVQLDKLVAEKLAAGWVRSAAPVIPPSVEPAEPREPALEAALAADPYDAQAYSVYGDWYQSQQHPRGELIALQLAEEEDGQTEKLRAAVRNHLARYRAVLLGELAQLDVEGASPFGWRFGFIHRLELLDGNGGDLEDLLRRTLRHPSGRFLAEVSARIHSSSLDAILTELAGVPTLRELSIAAAGTLTDTSPLARPAKLTKLVLKGNVPDDQPSVLAGLARVAPTLESLMLRVKGTGVWSGLAPLFGRRDLALRHLGMRSPGLVDPAICALADGPLAAHVETLDIALTDPDDALRALLAKRDRFASLRVLKLTFDRVVPKALAALRGSIAKVIDDNHYDPDDDYTHEDHEDLYDEVQE